MHALWYAVLTDECEEIVDTDSSSDNQSDIKGGKRNVKENKQKVFSRDACSDSRVDRSTCTAYTGSKSSEIE